MRSYCSKLGANLRTGLYEKGEVWTQRYRGEGHVMTERDHSDALASSHQELGRARKYSSPGPSEGTWPYRYLNFRLLASRTVRE